MAQTHEELCAKKREAYRKRIARIREENGGTVNWPKKPYTEARANREQAIRNANISKGLLYNGKPRLSEEEKEIRKQERIAKQKAFFNTDAGIALLQKLKESNTKYASKRERDDATNKRKRERLATDLDANLRNRIAACKSRARKQGIPFDIDFDYIKSIYTGYCPYLGIKLNLRASSGNSMDALSIDKIVPELGYVKGNVQIVSYKANVMKQDVDLDTLRKFATSVLLLHKKEE